MTNTSRNFDTSNWGQAPHNRSSFQYVQSLFPTARLRRGAHSASVFQRRDQDLSAITYLGLDGQQRDVQQMLRDTYTDAFLVIQDDAIVMESYDNGMAPDSHHLLNSVSKTFLSMLLGTLVADGLIDPNERVTKYMPEFANTAFRETTVQHALDMTAAVSFGEDYADPLADFWIETSVVGWRPALVNDRTPATLHDYARSLTKTEQLDGEKFHYRTVLTNVLAMVIEQATSEQVQHL
ncbi:MAG: serine hydrolase domain-containing protein, partial [Pseudomonadales bacterium]